MANLANYKEEVLGLRAIAERFRTEDEEFYFPSLIGGFHYNQNRSSLGNAYEGKLIDALQKLIGNATDSVDSGNHLHGHELAAVVQYIADLLEE